MSSLLAAAVLTLAGRFFQELNKSFKVVLSFVDIFESILVFVSSDVFDDVAFKEVQAIRVIQVRGRYGKVFVVL